jgi:hypothetical protein
MEKFLLAFVNAFKEDFYTSYQTCAEFKCGFFAFDNYRPLPITIVVALGLIEHEGFDPENDEWLFYYSTNFAS